MSLSGALRQVEEATPEGFEMRKRLVGLLVESISLGKSQQEGRGPDNLPFRTTPGLGHRVRRVVYACCQER
jgi:hypothetical protein